MTEDELGSGGQYVMKDATELCSVWAPFPAGAVYIGWTLYKSESCLQTIEFICYTECVSVM